MMDISFPEISDRPGPGEPHQVRADACFPAFWTDDALAEAFAICPMSEEPRRLLENAWQTIRKNTCLRRLLEHIYFEIFNSLRHDFPALPDALGEPGRLLYALALLAHAPETGRFYRARNIDLEVARETLTDLERWILHFRRRTGLWGFDNVPWLRKHFTGSIFSLGRLQFEAVTFQQHFHIYRHSASGKLAALAEDNMPCDLDGFPVSGAPAWIASFRETPDTVSGHAACPISGNISRERIRLDKREWCYLCHRGTDILGVHIPEGEPLKDAACLVSYKRASRFFPRFFPERKFCGMQCITWILDPQLREYLSVTSNLRVFASRFQPLPVRDATDAQLFERVFGGKKNLSELPQDTELRRGVVAHVKKGGKWRLTAGFKALDDNLPDRH